MEDQIITFGRTPRFIKFVKPNEIESGNLNLPDEFIDDYGSRVPSEVTLTVPNGEEYKGQYNQTLRSILGVDALLNKYRKENGMVLIIDYQCNDIFCVHVMNDGRSEILYDNGHILIDEEEINNGIESKFFCLMVGHVLRDGRLEIPTTYLNRFESKIPNDISIEVNSGEVFHGEFSRKHKQIFGLLDIIRREYIRPKDFVMFTYRGAGRFDIGIFDNGFCEKKIMLNVINIESGSEEGNGSSDNDDSGNIGDLESDDSDNEGDLVFTATATPSSVDGKSHGMYIPNEVQPRNRGWNGGEHIILRTDEIDCNVALVLSGSLARFSAGWNNFVRKIGLEVNNILQFTMVQDNDDGVVFSVRKI